MNVKPVLGIVVYRKILKELVQKEILPYFANIKNIIEIFFRLMSEIT